MAESCWNAAATSRPDERPVAPEVADQLQRLQIEQVMAQLSVGTHFTVKSTRADATGVETQGCAVEGPRCADARL
eukprot:9489663-Pyramimonas_sp.AAC.1